MTEHTDSTENSIIWIAEFYVRLTHKAPFLFDRKNNYSINNKQILKISKLSIRLFQRWGLIVLAGLPRFTGGDFWPGNI